jgi:hypothetical protein
VPTLLFGKRPALDESRVKTEAPATLQARFSMFGRTSPEPGPWCGVEPMR